MQSVSSSKLTSSMDMPSKALVQSISLSSELFVWVWTVRTMIRGRSPTDRSIRGRGLRLLEKKMPSWSGSIRLIIRGLSWDRVHQGRF